MGSEYKIRLVISISNDDPVSQVMQDRIKNTINEMGSKLERLEDLDNFVFFHTFDVVAEKQEE